MSDRTTPSPGWPAHQLVDACLAGDQAAWNALIGKYKHLVYKIIVSYRASEQEAHDLFQSIWLDVYLELGKLRKKSSIKSWLISVATHKCYRWKQTEAKEQRFHELTPEAENFQDDAKPAPALIEQLEREQTVRDAIGLLDTKCRRLIRLLFYSEPKVPYRVIAEQLGIAQGSIGVFRGRCLDRLTRKLKKLGLR